MLEHRPVAGQEAGVEQRGLDGDVAARILDAFGHGARGVADLQPEVPQQVEHELHRPPPGRAERRVGQEQQVDVRIGRQHPAAIAAGRHQGEALLRSGCEALPGHRAERCSAAGAERCS
jgi:hypothetical protein